MNKQEQGRVDTRICIVPMPFRTIFEAESFSLSARLRNSVVPCNSYHRLIVNRSITRSLFDVIVNFYYDSKLEGSKPETRWKTEFLDALASPERKKLSTRISMRRVESMGGIRRPVDRDPPVRKVGRPGEERQVGV